MQGSRNIDILMHIRDYCAEINHTMDTFGRDYDIFVSNSIYQNAVALCVLQIGELTTHFTDEFLIVFPFWEIVHSEPSKLIFVSLRASISKFKRK